LAVRISDLENDPRFRKLGTVLPERDGHPLAHIGLAFRHGTSN